MERMDHSYHGSILCEEKRDLETAEPIEVYRSKSSRYSSGSPPARSQKSNQRSIYKSPSRNRSNASIRFYPKEEPREGRPRQKPEQDREAAMRIDQELRDDSYEKAKRQAKPTGMKMYMQNKAPFVQAKPDFEQEEYDDTINKYKRQKYTFLKHGNYGKPPNEESVEACYDQGSSYQNLVAADESRYMEQADQDAAKDIMFQKHNKSSQMIQMGQQTTTFDERVDARRQLPGESGKSYLVKRDQRGGLEVLPGPLQSQSA